MWYKTKSTTNLFLVIALFFSIALLIISTSTFIFSFGRGDYSLSNNITDWGNFGDYLSGTTGVIISFLNVVILYKFSLVGQEFNRMSMENKIKGETFNFFIAKIDRIFDKINEIFSENDINTILKDDNLRRTLINSFYSYQSYINNFEIELSGFEEEIKDTVGKSFKIFNFKIDKPKRYKTTYERINEINILIKKIVENYEANNTPEEKDLSDLYVSRAYLIRDLKKDLLNI